MRLSRPGVQPGDAGSRARARRPPARAAAPWPRPCPRSSGTHVHPLDLTGAVRQALDAAAADRLPVAVSDQEGAAGRARARPAPAFGMSERLEVELRQYSSRISATIAATSAAPSPLPTGTCRKSQLTGHAYTRTDRRTTGSARRRDRCAGTLYDAPMPTRRRMFAVLAALFACAALFWSPAARRPKTLRDRCPDAAGLLQQSTADHQGPQERPPGDHRQRQDRRPARSRRSPVI